MYAGLRAGNIKHNNLKTVYYDNVLIKIYDIPILYLPKLAHPDPTVKKVGISYSFIFRH